MYVMGGNMVFGGQYVWQTSRTAAKRSNDCAKGKYQPLSHAMTCIACPTGKTTASTGAKYQSQCSLTKYCNGADSGCSNIARGDGDCDRDSDCQSGLQCGSSSRCLTSVCPSCSWWDDCCYQPCSAGQYMSGTTKTCQNCQPGKYQPSSGGTTSCIDCPVGKYSSSSQSTSCSTCPNGWTTKTAASTAASQCLCNGKNDGCRNIARGDGDCDVDSDCQSGLQCADGKGIEWKCDRSVCPGCASSWPATDDCCYQPCSAGQYMSSTTKTCQNCQPGKYQPSSGGTSSCIDCAAGQYSSSSQSTSCSTCSKDTYSVAGSTSCTSCPSGETSSAGSSGCQGPLCSSQSSSFCYCDQYPCFTNCDTPRMCNAGQGCKNNGLLQNSWYVVVLLLGNLPALFRHSSCCCVIHNIRCVDGAVRRVLRESIKLLMRTRLCASTVRKARPRQARAQNFYPNAPFLSVRATTISTVPAVWPVRAAKHPHQARLQYRTVKSPASACAFRTLRSATAVLVNARLAEFHVSLGRATNHSPAGLVMNVTDGGCSTRGEYYASTIRALVMMLTMSCSQRQVCHRKVSARRAQICLRLVSPRDNNGRDRKHSAVRLFFTVRRIVHPKSNSVPIAGFGIPSHELAKSAMCAHYGAGYQRCAEEYV
eukprot:COSAG01_NODE_4368_length_5092_cov_3.378730_2_plen_648_part_00